MAKINLARPKATGTVLIDRRTLIALGGLVLMSAPMTGDEVAGQASGREIEVLLVCGLHANEACAPLMAEKVLRLLKDRGIRVALFRVPRNFTLLGLLDDPATAVTRYSIPAAGAGRLDMDLDGLDAILRGQYPHARVFEFHNSEDSARVLAIDPVKPVCDYEVGVVGPRFVRPYEIATWRNIDLRGRPSKDLIETPACYRDVTRETLSKRLTGLARLRAEGHEFDARWMSYLQLEADVEASRRRGYLEDCLAEKIADWIFKHRGLEHGPEGPP